ncbi:tetratricopeptide repeat protein [Scopulibacillus darangshiensis]|uniref:Tetratricopeptide repeat protein n=1 Tax=Scopulibacillus darangshiensis TaxID=442528 RepID=A0A4R2NSF1_9BACL|nr:tetratricopeptide repeat protein [Scopulibacillus darangshiensis]TCP24873.1 tetratricopeptide repeat protein [Scopulibacillus darangshiensis]
MKSERMSKKARVITFHPDGEYYFQKGITAYQKGDLLRASKYVDRAIAFEPEETEYLCQQAAILSELEEYEASIDILRKVVMELDEHLTECYFFMANNYAYLGRFEEALKEVRTYISLEPKGGFIQEARELYKLLTIESGGLHEEDEGYVAEHEKGRQALERGQYKKAVTLFKKVIVDRPSFWAAYNNLAVAYYSQGNTPQAYKTIERVLEQDPGNVHALCNLTTFYYQLNETEKLEALLPKIDSLYPFFPEHRSKLGSTYLFIGEYEKAFHWLMSAEKAGIYGDQAFYFWLALASFRVGLKELAIRTWNQANFFKDQPFHPYQYGKVREMFLADDAKDNPMVRSLVHQQLAEADSSTHKVYSLFYLRYLGDQAAYDQIKAISQTKESPLVSAIAARLLKSNDDSVDIMLILEEHFGNSRPMMQYCDLYGWWAIVFDLIQTDDDIEAKAWAAALAYLWKKENEMAETQSRIAKQFDTTVYQLRKHVNRLRDGLDDLS